ncbi:unknown [Bacteroides sp. CAG:927]|nr:unknown [Bacteroides sp. CAG:927]
MLTCETLVDELVLFIVAHEVAEVLGLHALDLTFELVDYYPPEILLVDGIVRAEGGSIVIIDHGLVAVRYVIAAKVLDECRYLAIEIDVEGLDYIEAAAS